MTQIRIRYSRTLPVAALLTALVVPAAGWAESAPGAPGLTAATWSEAAKTGIGTAYQPYDSGSAAVPSTVWFSIAHGIVTETMFGMIHEIQLKDVQFALQGKGFVETEQDDTDSQTSYLDQDAAGRPLSLAYRVVNRSRHGRYVLEKQIFTDPRSNSLFLHVTIHATGATVTPVLLVDPQLQGRAGHDHADFNNGVLHAFQGDVHVAVKGSVPFEAASVGFVRRSDALTELRHDGIVSHRYDDTGAQEGAVRLSGSLPTIAKGHSATFDIVIGFGRDSLSASAAVDQSLARGHDAVLANYNGQNGQVGWESYLRTLSELPKLQAVAEDGGRLVNVSAMVLKAQEDKLHPGALIASLSTPWGDSVSAAAATTGYRAVWPRDFYQCAMALLALGDRKTPLVALRYLKTIQVRADTPGNHGANGWFLQKTHVDGTVEWVGVQLDQTAMPIMLAWKLWQAGLLDDTGLRALFGDMLKPAADFLVDGGDVNLQWNHAAIHPPITQQERWEEQAGDSPSTTAAIVTGLTVAADMARHLGDNASADRYQQAADGISNTIEARMSTTNGPTAGRPTVARHYLRIAPNGDPNSHAVLFPRNGKAALPEDAFLDGGFLELVRYGVRPPTDPVIRSSLAILDDGTLPDEARVKYEFHFPHVPSSIPGWRRYGHDGYGEDVVTGGNYGVHPGDRLAGGVDDTMPETQRGRVWPIFTGERGHFELAAALADPHGPNPAEIDSIRRIYVHGMELFANQGLMIPEQVWDGVGGNWHNRYRAGVGTDSATPLSWAHAEYVKLLRSIADQQIWDRYAPVAARYATAGAGQ